MDEMLFTTYAAAALAGVVQRGAQPDNWQAAVAASIGAAMVAEHRKRYPMGGGHLGGKYPPATAEAVIGGKEYRATPTSWLHTHPEIAQDTLRANPAYGDFHRVAHSLGLTVAQANEIWSRCETNHDAFLTLYVTPWPKGYIDPDNGQYVGPSNSHNPPMDYPRLPDMYEPDDTTAATLPLVDPAGHSVEALEPFGPDDIPRGAGGIGGITTARASYVEGPDAAPQLSPLGGMEGAVGADPRTWSPDPLPRNPVETVESLLTAAGHELDPERVRLAKMLMEEPVAQPTLTCTCHGLPLEQCPDVKFNPQDVVEERPVDSFIANGVEYRRNEHGSYEAHRSVDTVTADQIAGQTGHGG